MLFLPVFLISRYASSIWFVLLWRIERSTGGSRSSSLALYSSARRSFGRHEPPNAKPGCRYAGEMFSFSSRQKTFRHLGAVDAQPLGDQADLVGECDLQRVERVAGVLDHFGHGKLRAEDRRRKRRIQLGEDLAASRIKLADDREGRTPVVA